MKNSTRSFIFAAVDFIFAAILLIVMLICLPNLPIAIIVLDCFIIGYDIATGISNIILGVRRKRWEALYD